jgi:anti-anti-sigma factor
LRSSHSGGGSLQFLASAILRTGAITDLQRLTVSLRGGCERRDACLLFSFTGQLDAYSDKQFTEFISSSNQGESLPVVIDLSRIDFIDSSGLGALVQLAKQFNESSRQFVVVGNARVVQTVKLVRLEAFLHLQPDLDAALGSLTPA